MIDILLMLEYSTVQYCTVLYSTVQYRTVLYSTVQYCIYISIYLYIYISIYLWGPMGSQGPYGALWGPRVPGLMDPGLMVPGLRDPGPRVPGLRDPGPGLETTIPEISRRRRVRCFGDLLTAYDLS